MKPLADTFRIANINLAARQRINELFTIPAPDYTRIRTATAPVSMFGSGANPCLNLSTAAGSVCWLNGSRRFLQCVRFSPELEGPWELQTASSASRHADRASPEHHSFPETVGAEEHRPHVSSEFRQGHAWAHSPGEGNPALGQVRLSIRYPAEEPVEVKRTNARPSDASRIDTTALAAASSILEYQGQGCR